MIVKKPLRWKTNYPSNGNDRENNGAGKYSLTRAAPIELELDTLVDIANTKNDNILNMESPLNMPLILGWDFLFTLKELIHKYSPTILTLVEKKICGMMSNDACKKAGFDIVFHVEANGFGGGIWVLWLKEKLSNEQLAHLNKLYVSSEVKNVAFDMKSHKAPVLHHKEKYSLKKSYSLTKHTNWRINYVNGFIMIGNSLTIPEIDRHALFRSLSMLRTIGKLDDSKYMRLEKQVALFLYIITHHTKNQIVHEAFWKS
ncbi:hypothetical protein Cgig2_015050 [Carnegiea gigantea]|uniref:DUF8040 domain-containing protein n=1 Tax=Carnegiea gigantea TaxID=171969 RepID=A0A9Q1K6E5_9CARY|nr:hypothetical protein Cgig2_015050 [Carnegiea gigantea]